MVQYIIKRLFQLLVVFGIVSIFAFSIVYFAPGDPLYLYTSPSVSSYKMTEEQMDEMREALGLKGNMIQRYSGWAKNMLKGDWGLSISNRQPVKEQIMARLPNTVGLMGASLVLSILMAIPLGLLAGYCKKSWINKAIDIFCYMGISFPPFWLGILLIIAFSLKLNWFPSSGMRTIGVNSVFDVIWHGILPVIVLSMNQVAGYIRYIRAEVIEQMKEEYVMAAYAKGMPIRRVLRKHVLKNCLLPIITMAGMNFGTLITGSFIIETVFGWPGIGILCMDAINNRDYPMIMGITTLSCGVLLFGNFLADILYGLVDPRIKKGGKR